VSTGGRPIKSRTSAAFALEAARLGRLRMSLICDSRLDKQKVKRAVECIDGLIDEIVYFSEYDLNFLSAGQSEIKSAKG
jgi:hypothetical protein